jgi:hypothetical protein
MIDMQPLAAHSSNVEGHGYIPLYILLVLAHAQVGMTTCFLEDIYVLVRARRRRQIAIA